MDGWAWTRDGMDGAIHVTATKAACPCCFPCAPARSLSATPFLSFSSKTLLVLIFFVSYTHHSVSPPLSFQRPSLLVGRAVLESACTRFATTLGSGSTTVGTVHRKVGRYLSLHLPTKTCNVTYVTRQPRASRDGDQSNNWIGQVPTAPPRPPPLSSHRRKTCEAEAYAYRQAVRICKTSWHGMYLHTCMCVCMYMSSNRPRVRNSFRRSGSWMDREGVGERRGRGRVA
ncbi:hypothetical protein IWZ03DRAFT_369289 [Phyllosticta citriasiana]|uniref:Uncharacterized protein n=1 Tax=Phyllosticta citriasiana TaxID=595635 RepID=A0ABR1KVN7_9PEZI